MVKENIDKLIKSAEQKEKLFYKNGDTFDIITTVMNVFENHYTELKDFSLYLKSDDIPGTCKNIWDFLKQNIRYIKDPQGVQWIKTPARLWADKTGDCKSLSVFAASVLRCLHIPYVFRFVSFSKDDATPTHVYVVAKHKNQEIIIDAVLNEFNKEHPFYFKKDMAAISQLSGISGGLATAINKSGRMQHLNEGLPSLSILALYQFIPAGPTGQLPNMKEIVQQYAHPTDLLSKCPDIVKQKRVASFQTFWDLGDWANIKVEVEVFPRLRQILTDKLGIDPTIWWINQFKSGNISGLFDFLKKDNSGGGGDSGKGLNLNAYSSVITTALSSIKNLFGNSDFQFKHGSPDALAPSENDWPTNFNPLKGIDLSYATGNKQTGGGNLSSLIDKWAYPGTSNSGSTGGGGWGIIPTDNSGNQGYFNQSNSKMGTYIGLGAAAVVLLLLLKK